MLPYFIITAAILAFVLANVTLVRLVPAPHRYEDEV